MGANGAGKTTTLRAISGLVKPMGGLVRLDGADLEGISPTARVRAGSCTSRRVAGSSTG